MQWGEGKRRPASAPGTEAEAAVLGDDDLLREILVRLDHPTCLVHAALVSRRWLRHASDPAFLRRFRALHPPRVLGLYMNGSGSSSSRFVPLPHPRELDVVFRRASFQPVHGWVADCRNGRLLVFRNGQQVGNCPGFEVRSPLHHTPHFGPVVPSIYDGSHYFLPEDGGDGMCYTAVKLMRRDTQIFAQHFIVRAGVRTEVRSSAAIEPPSPWQRHVDCALLVNNKCHILGDVGYILRLDLASMCLCVINVPDGVQQHHNMKNIALSRADGSGFHLIHLQGFQIHVWHHDDREDGDAWRLVHTLCLRQAIAHLEKSDYWETVLESGCKFVRLHRVGDNAEFLLNLGVQVFRMYIGSRKVEKVFEMPLDDNLHYLDSVIHPFMMAWPPSFPA